MFAQLSDSTDQNVDWHNSLDSQRLTKRSQLIELMKGTSFVTELINERLVTELVDEAHRLYPGYEPDLNIYSILQQFAREPNRIVREQQIMGMMDGIGGHSKYQSMSVTR